MLQRNEIRNSTETPQMRATSPEATDVLKIEEILRRAREIHRQHGGMFGYDFEDWVQAWSDLPASNGCTKLELAEEMTREVAANDTEEGCESCFRYDN